MSSRSHRRSRTLRAGGRRARVAAIAALVVVAGAASAAAGYLAFSSNGSPGSASAPGHGAPASTPARAGTPASRPASPAATQPSGAASVTLPRLSPAQLVGQRVIYSYSGLTPPAALLRLIRHGQAAGVIFFGHNITSLAQIAKVITELDAANASPQNPVRAPLLLMTDQEGGVVRRMPGAPLLSERQIGAAPDPAAQARAAGAGAALNLRGVGMNVNLAPVLDVYRQPGDFDDQFGRSYSTSPGVVSALGADFIAAQQHGGVAATAKHFPGLGAATQPQNTDKVPVTLAQPVSVIRSTDELPYRAAIAAGVRLVMVSWAVYPALDPGRPAGLSATIVGGELRQRLGFQGVTITDALEAGALRPFGTIQNRSLLAARAGMDLLLCSEQDYTEGQQAAAALASGYHDGALGASDFTAAVRRVIALRVSLAR